MLARISPFLFYFVLVGLGLAAALLWLCDPILQIVLFAGLVLAVSVVISHSGLPPDKVLADVVYYTIGILGAFLFFVAEAPERDEDRLRASVEQASNDLKTADAVHASAVARLENNAAEQARLEAEIAVLLEDVQSGALHQLSETRHAAVARLVAPLALDLRETRLKIAAMDCAGRLDTLRSHRGEQWDLYLDAWTAEQLRDQSANENPLARPGEPSWRDPANRLDAFAPPSATFLNAWENFDRNVKECERDIALAQRLDELVDPFDKLLLLWTLPTGIVGDAAVSRESLTPEIRTELEAIERLRQAPSILASLNDRARRAAEAEAGLAAAVERAMQAATEARRQQEKARQDLSDFETQVISKLVADARRFLRERWPFLLIALLGLKLSREPYLPIGPLFRKPS